MSSSEQVFIEEVKPYEEALKESGYKHEKKYEEKNIDEMNKKKKRNRQKRQQNQQNQQNQQQKHQQNQHLPPFLKSIE